MTDEQLFYLAMTVSVWFTAIGTAVLVFLA
jgi:hypothetical protein